MTVVTTLTTLFIGCSGRIALDEGYEFPQFVLIEVGNTRKAVSVPPTIVTGLLAWQFQLEGARLKGSLLLHLILAIASGVVILGTWLLHLRVRREQGPVSAGARLAIEGFGALLLAAAAHLGGVVSGVNPPL